MESSQELQDLYSSTSSDDQSSINSVVHVGGALEESESDRSAPTTPKRHRPNGEIGHRLQQQDDSTSDESELDEEALVRAEEERQRDEDTSSTSSEETQIWVPAHRPNGNHLQGASKPSVPPKPSYRNSMGNGGSSSGAGARTSMISQNSSTGKVEVVLVSEDQAHSTNADSGISNESPENHSGGERDSAHYNPPSSAASSHHHGHHGHRHNNSSLHSPRSHSSSERSSQSSNMGLHAHMNAVQYHSSPSHHSNHSHVVTLPTIPSPSASPVTPHSILKSCDPLILPHPDQAFMKQQFRDSLFNILSGLYAMFLVVIGASLPIAEVFATTIPFGVFEGFYIYLFLVSIIFLTYVYLFLLRNKTTSSRLKKRHKHKHRHGENALLKSPKRRNISVTDNHTGSFYLRLGAVGFGVGAMIHEGLMFGQVFESKLVAECINITEVIRPVVQLAFTFIQLYFIFLNSKMCIHKYKVFARFGLMHMVATNLCVWLRVVVEETIREIHEHVHLRPGSRYHRNNQTTSHHVTVVTSPPPSTVHLSIIDGSGEGPSYSETNHSGGMHHDAPIDCHKQEIISQVVEASSPFLYPCTIEYSLIAAGILYIMWRNIGREPPPMTPEEHQNNLERMKKQHRHTVDCAGANRGLFFGIFTLVGIIISMIVFFVLVDKPEFSNTAVMVVHISEIVLYFLALVAVSVAAFRIKDMNFHNERDNSLDEILLLCSLVGVLLFCVFSIVAGRYNVDSYGGMLVMSSSVLIMVEAVVQTVFVLNGLRRSSRLPSHGNKKPGRECITFLLVCNVAMWGINTFEVMRSDSNPIAMEFYGFLPWSIITHISTPLAIFHRFHSTVCLASVWLDAYKFKQH